MVHTKIKFSQNCSNDKDGDVNYYPPKKIGADRRLCSRQAHFWAISDSATRSEAAATSEAAGVM